MRTLKITGKFLVERKACQRGRDRFAELFPRGLAVTDDQMENWSRIAPVLSKCEAYEPGQSNYDDSDHEAHGFLIWLSGDLFDNNLDEDNPLDPDNGNGSCEVDPFYECGRLAEAVAYHLTRKAVRS